MKLFDKSFSLFFVACGWLLIFLPKINLISFDKETAGIRIDDVMLLFFALAIGWAHFALQKRINPIEGWTAAIIFSGIISFVLNRFFIAEEWIHVKANLFYCLRLAEYFIFFYIGAFSARFSNVSTLMKAFFLWNILLIALQKLGLIGQFTVDGYNPYVSGRSLGIASFPSEGGMLLNLMFCFFIYSDETNTRLRKLIPPNFRSFFAETYVYWMFLLFSILIIFTGSRIALVGLAIPFLFRIKDQFKARSFASWFFAISFLSAAIFMTVVMIQNNKAISERSTGLLSIKNLELISIVWDSIDITSDPGDYESVKFQDYDLSWWMRIHKWCYLLKAYALHPECWLQGVGPGVALAAVDGGLIRILTEYGLIGCYLFWRLFRSISQQSVQLHWMIIAFALNMIFFDVYLAYKPMSIIFFVSGWTWVHAHSLRPSERCIRALA
ncbi:MAG: hypothetical protein WCG42_07970 [Parachlamydiaceae bacterium]